MTTARVLLLVVALGFVVQLPLAFTINRLRGWGCRGKGPARILYRRVYLKTPWWRLVSKAVKSRAGYRCEECHVRTLRLDAHHKGRAAYALLGREWAPWRGLSPLLEALCRPCHARKHP